ncbi:uncharacterized protein LOC134817914 [Bolinopsis microptera]|uniref:uncharacterized protein LOC134817914 n=1 Tax=Bolinopsis microptera TaxID=2820187 RepID=UPI003079F0CD
MGTLQFIGWLKHHLDRRTFEGCVWVNKEQQVFKILWPRADKNLTPDKLGVMFKWWTHKFGNTRNHNQPTAIKGNFRSCLNSKVQSKEIKKLKNMDDRSDADDWKVFQFTENLKDNRNTSGYTKRRQNKHSMVPEPNDSDLDKDKDTAPYDPGEFFADDSIRAEHDDVKQKTRPWVVTLTAYAKQRTKLWEYTYNFAREDMGTRKVHVYVKGEPRKTKILPMYFKKYIPSLDFNTVNNDSSIDPNSHEFLKKEFSDATNPQKVFTLQDTFCPGFIFEVDRSFNIFITRLSQSRLYFGHHGEQNQWQKLEKVKNDQSYNETEEHKDGVKQMVFSYKKFLHSAKVYDTWLQHGKPAMDLIDYRVLMPVDTTPRMGMGCDGDCNFYFEIEHHPAKNIFQTIRRREEGKGNQIFISEDPFADDFANLALQDEPKQSPAEYVPDPCELPPGVVIKTQPVAPPPYNESQVYVNTHAGQYGPGPFDNPGPNVWSPHQQQQFNITPQQFSSSVPHQQRVPQPDIEQLMQDKLTAEGHYHAGHLPASPMQAQGTDQYPGGYGHQQFMQEMDQSGVQSCESSWSETGSDFTVTNPHSPYMADISCDQDFCLRTPDCLCLSCLTRRGGL